MSGFTSNKNNLFTRGNRFVTGPMSGQNSFKNRPANFNSSCGNNASFSSGNSITNPRKRENVDISPVNLLQDSWMLKVNSFPTQYKNVLLDVTKKLDSYHINFFSPIIIPHKSGSNQLKLMCDLCDVTLPIVKIENHIQDQTHICNLAEKANNSKLKFSKLQIGMVSADNLDAVGRDQHGSHFDGSSEAKKIIGSSGKNLNEHEKKIIMGFGKDADKILESFEFTYSNGNQLNFICNVCQLCLYPKYVRSHLKNCSGVKNLMQNLCLAYLEDLNSKNKSILNKLIDRLGEKLNFLQLHFRFGSNRLRFFCYLCHLVLANKDVEEHVHSKMHKKKLQMRPFSLSVESLSEYNKRIVKKITESIRERIEDFYLLYKIGTEKLDLYCKLCQRPVSVDEVELHAQLSQHLSKVSVQNCDIVGTEGPPKSKLLPQHPTAITSTELSNVPSQLDKAPLSLTETEVSRKVAFFTARLNEKDKKIILDFGHDAERILDSFDISYKNANRLNFICNVCKLCLWPKYVKSHLKSCSGVKDLMDDLCLVFFQDLNSVNRAILHKLINQLKNRLVFLQLYYKFGTNKLRYFCPLCPLVLVYEDVRDHVFSKEHENNLQNKSFSLKIESLNQSNQLTVHKISTEIKERMADFNFLHKIGTEELLFYCKLCKISLSPHEVKDHVKESQHSSRIFAKHNNTRQFAEQKSFQHYSNYSPPPSTISKSSGDITERMVPHSVKAGVSEKVASSIQHFNQRDKKIILDFGPEAEKILDSFIRNYDNSDRLNFICKICKLSLVPKYVKSHFHNCTRLENLMKNLQFVNLEDLSADDATLVKNLSDLHDSKLYNFQLLLGCGSNYLYFFCKACNLVLGSEVIEDHIYSNIHAQNLLSHPPRIAYHSLSNLNKQAVKGLTAVIRNRISDFNFVYKIGTEELQFHCKVCHVVVRPEKVKNHVKWDEHMKRVIAILGNSYDKLDKIPLLPTPPSETLSSASKPSTLTPLSKPVSAPLTKHQQNFSAVNFDSLSETQQKLVKCSIGEEDYKYFEFLLAVDSNKLHLKCKLCDATVECPLILNHLLSADHESNGKLNTFFDNFISLEESSKNTLRTLFNLISSEVKSFVLLPFSDQKRHKIMCKICDLSIYLDTVDSGWLAQHLHSHTETVKDININCTEPANNSKFVASKEQPLQKVGMDSRLSSAFSKTNAIASPSNVVKNESDKDNTTNRKSSTNCKPESEKKFEIVNPMPSCKDDKDQFFTCIDCNENVKFKTVGSYGHKFTKPINDLFIRCHGKPTSGTLPSWEERHSSKNAEPLEPAPGILSDLDKQVFKELIDKIGFEIKDFDLMLEPKLSELRFKCKFCLFILRPETVESHIKTGYHLKHSKIAGIQSLGFESLSPSGRETVKDLYGRIGIGISCLEVESTIIFICKPCSARMSPDDVVKHFSSKEHHKQLSLSHSETNPLSSKFQPVTHPTGSRNVADKASDKEESPTPLSLNSPCSASMPPDDVVNPFLSREHPKQFSLSSSEKKTLSSKFQPVTHPTGSRNIADKASGKEKGLKPSSLNSQKTNNVQRYLFINPSSSMDEAESASGKSKPLFNFDSKVKPVKKVVPPKSTFKPAENSSQPRKMAEDSDNSFVIINEPRQIPKNSVEEALVQHAQTSSATHLKKTSSAEVSKPFNSSSGTFNPQSTYPFKRSTPETVTTSRCSSNIFPGVTSNPRSSLKGILKPEAAISSQSSSMISSGSRTTVNNLQSTSKEVLKPEAIITPQFQVSSPSLSNLTSRPQNQPTSWPQESKPQYSSNSSPIPMGSKPKISSKDTCSLM